MNMNFRRIALPLAGGLVGITALASAFTPVLSKVMPVDTLSTTGGAKAVVTTPPVSLPTVPVPDISPATTYAEGTLSGAQGVAGSTLAGVQGLASNTVSGVQSYAGGSLAGAEGLVNGALNTVKGTVDSLPGTVQNLVGSALSSGLTASVCPAGAHAASPIGSASALLCANTSVNQ
jgi:hypothetical protein